MKTRSKRSTQTHGILPLSLLSRVPNRAIPESVDTSENPISQPAKSSFTSYKWSATSFLYVLGTPIKFLHPAGVFAFISFIVVVLLIVRRLKRGNGAKEERKFAKMESALAERTESGGKEGGCVGVDDVKIVDRNKV
jgi:hypothetical protein